MKKILIVVDVQRGFIVEGANGHVPERIDALLNTGVFDCVIATVYKNYDGSPISKISKWDYLKSASEQELVGEVKKADFTLEKYEYSSYSPALEKLLIEQNGGDMPECVFVVGVDTECCVLATATDLFEKGIRPIVLSHYCGASEGEEAHLAGVRALYSLIGVSNVYDGQINSDGDILAAVDRAKAGGYEQTPSTQKKAEKVVELLKSKSLKISFAESCTGGLACATLVAVPGASDVIDSSFVTYANDAKIKFLGVSEDSISAYGVVSEQVASEMAEGVRKTSGADVGVGVTGIAGPGGQTATKPVGMVCFGFSFGETAYTVTRRFGEIGRNAVRRASVEFVLDTLLEIL